MNLSPASIPKVGSGFDLAICVAALVASGAIPPDVVRDVVHIGELGLDGTSGRCRAPSPVLAAARRKVRHVVVPLANAAEARLVPGVRVHPVKTLDKFVERYASLTAGSSRRRFPSRRPNR